MTRRCVVGRCSNVKGQGNGIYLHRMPYFGDDRPEANRRKKRVDFVLRMREIWSQLRRSIRLCAQHTLETKTTELILKCLKNVQGIPESSIVSCLQYVLSADGSVFGDEGKDKVQPPDTSAVEEKMIKDHLENNTENSSKLSKCLFGDKRTDLLCHILGYPVNDVFIQDSVRHLTSESVTVLLRFLAHIVQFASRSSFAREESPLKYPLVVDWTGWLVDAHYTSLALMTDVHELLLDLHDSVQDQITLFQKLSRLDGFLMHYKNKQPLPKTERIGPYSVEMLEL